jgi:hypothetical protein
MSDSWNVRCPACHATAGQPCRGEDVHPERVARFLAIKEDTEAIRTRLVAGWTCGVCRSWTAPSHERVDRCRVCGAPSLTAPSSLPPKRWKYVLQSYGRGQDVKLYRGPFDTYADAKREARAELENGSWDQAWVYEVVGVPKRRTKE